MTDALVTAVSILLDEDARAHLAGTITHTTHGDTRIIVFSAHARTGEWTYSAGNATFAKDLDGVVTERRGSGGDTSSASRPAHIPLELRLGFPASLPVWDRPGDEWRITGATSAEDEIRLALSHREHPEIHASVTIDTVRRLFTSFVTPTDSFKLDAADSPVDMNGRFAYYEQS